MKAKKTKHVIDYSEKNHKILGLQIRKKKLPIKEVGNQLKQAKAASTKAIYAYTRGLISTQKTKKQFLSEGKKIFDVALNFPSPSRKMMLKAIVEETGRAGSLFLIQNISGLKKVDARAYMKDLLASGGSVADAAVWLQASGKVLRRHNIKPSDTAEVVVDAVGEALEWVIDAAEDGVDALLEGIDTIIDAVTDAGAAIVDFFEEVVDWTAEQIGNLLAALVEAGIELIEFVGATFAWTYAAVSNFIQAALEVGFTIANLLETVVSQSYWVFRRFINGIIANLGPVGAVLDFILTQVEGVSSALWRRTLRALRFAEANLIAVLDWMATQTNMVFEGILRAWERIGVSLMRVYQWALTAGSAAWQAIGEATQNIGNSIYYAYNFLRTSGVNFIFDFTRGLLHAGAAIGGLIGWAVDQTVEICGEIIRAGLDAGQTVATMLVEIARNPGNALNTFIQGMQNIGQTLDNLYQAAIIDTTQEFLIEVNEALIELGTSIVEMCEAALRLGAAALATLIAALFSMLGTYRRMRPEEIADARLVFGNSLDYDLIFLSTEDALNKIIFGIQDFFTGNPNSRAFVTTNLINFDVAEAPIDRPTLIHELTHVWQSREVGGIYMAEAIFARPTVPGSSDPYNYGYSTTPVTRANALTVRDKFDGSTTPYLALGDLMGDGGDAALVAAGGNINAFNREQQGQIMMHWFVRTQLEIRNTAGALVTPGAAAWVPYQQFVFNS